MKATDWGCLLCFSYSVFEVVSVEQFAAFRAEDLMFVDHVPAVVAAIRLLLPFLLVLVSRRFHSDIIFLLP